MNKREKKVVDTLTIGSKVFLVHRDYAFKPKSHWGGIILQAKVRTFMNVKGNVVPLFREIGNNKRGDLLMAQFIPFDSVQKAIDAIK